MQLLMSTIAGFAAATESEAHPSATPVAIETAAPAPLRSREILVPKTAPSALRTPLTNPEQIHALAQKLAGVPIDVLINNAGLFVVGGENNQWNHAGAHYDGQNFGTLDYDQFDQFMRTNVAGPARVTEAFVANVKASKQKKIVAISSSNGQITGKPLCCGLFWYRTSKAALNKLMISISAVLKKEGVTVVMFNPGAVRVEKQADLEFPGMISTPVAVGGMIKAIDKITLADSGRFLQHDGTTEPW
jgi:NAD(P)-dependent dehydrogenase (short-subunit alcohol dehydrogenase family)